MVGGLALLPALLDRSAALSSGVGMPAIFAAFVKLGSVVYGSGYVLLAFLQSELVTRRSWLTSSQLLDAVAVGQITPGPVFTTATFIGFLLAGPRGAIVATLGMFLPAFLFVAISGRLVPRLRRSPIAAAFLDGVNVGSLGLMAAVLVQLGHDAIRDGLTAALSVMSAVVLVRFRTAPARLLLFGAVAGVAATAMRR
jgi:chromate transporter